jgi:CBS domain-containing protein
MSQPAISLPVDATVHDARRRFEREGHGAYPLIESDGSIGGIVARADLLQRTDGEDPPLRELGSHDVVTIEADDSVLHALRLMVEEEVDHLPVVDEGRLVGMCTRSDVLRARGRQLENERPQQGWRPTP